MNNNKNYWILALPIIGVIAMNIAILFMLFSEGTSENEELPIYDGSSSQMDPSSKLFLATICFAVAVLTISSITVIIAHNLKALKNPALERRGMLIIKLGLMPFFIVGGLLCLVLAVIPATGILSFFFVIMGWLIMMTGSVWSICYALSLRKMGAMSSGKMVLFVFTQFFFVLDVISAIVIAFVGRKSDVMSGEKIEIDIEAGLSLENRNN